ncbi:MAG: lysophospholipase [Deltaproteobacteria bacterium]|nr:lysophospholipase [Deltaproteobacteria bacterium]
MNHQEGVFEGVHHTRIYHQCWLPESEPKAVMMIVHGLGEHSGRYLNIVDHFVPMGFAIYGMDHPGHGRSEGTRKYVGRFEDFIDNVKAFFDKIQGRHAGKPIFLVGHSMGGLISAVYLLDHQDGLKGAILSGPSVKIPDNILPITIFIGKILAVLMPEFGLIGTAPADVSRDPAVVQAYLDDPLVHKGKTTAGLAAEILKAMQRVSRDAGRITLPILILQGGADRIVSPAGAKALYDAVGSIDKEIKIYDGLYHEVYNEPEHPGVLRDVELWIEARMK